MALRTLDSLGSLAGKRVIVRVDFNVPLKEGVITDDGRIRAALPTLNHLINQGARVIACSHLGRPDGAPDAKYSLEPVAYRLGELLKTPVAFASDTIGSSAEESVEGLDDGDPPAGDEEVAGGGPHLAAGHAEGGGLAGAVGAEEARDGARLAAEADVRDDGASAELLGEAVGFDHACSLAATSAARHGPRATASEPHGGGGERLW